MERNLRFKIDWPNLIAGSKFTVFALYLRAIFQVEAPGGLIFGEAISQRVFLRYRFGGVIFGGAYTWRGLLSEFYGIQKIPYTK